MQDPTDPNNPITDSIGDLLDSIDIATPSIEDGLALPSFLDTPATPELIEVVQLEPDEIDPRLKLLSHSSRTTLHKCPRKYQLYRLSSDQQSLEGVKEVEH